MSRDGHEPDFLDSQEDVRRPSLPLAATPSAFSKRGPGVAHPSRIIADGSPRNHRWSRAARDLVRANLTAAGAGLSALVTELVQQFGHSRPACRRFVRCMGIRSRRPQRRWSPAERKRLEKLIDLHPVNEIARILHRSQSSVWHALYRMGGNAMMGRDSFTKYSLAVALHASPIQIESWINRGWLKTREVQTGSMKRVIIAGEDFCQFCRTHTKEAVGNRLIQARFDFVYQFAFSPGHAELLPVRESKKERSAHAARLKEGESTADDERLDRIA